ncbi:MAG: OFA family MFS transporter [Rhodospirillaceae bacterium]|nr:OFA family MFS transporter [Rhodospirillaceae bacterium]
MTTTTFNRWLILIASLVVNICIGSAYAWSVYQKPLMNVLQSSTSDTSLAFTISLSVIPLAMIAAGKIQDNYGPKLVILTGGIIFGLGMLATGFCTSLTTLYLTYGVLGGAGIGTVYACTVANTVKFFPDKRGLASGLVVAGFGSGAVLIAPLSSLLIERYDVLTTFKALGISYAVLIAICVMFIKTAPADYRPAGWAPPAPAGGGAAAVSVNKDWRQMLTDPMFYVLFGIYVIGTVSGLMFIGHASPIAQEVIKVTPAVAAAAVGFMALANSGGRIFWGWTSDKIGRYNALFVMLIVEGIGMLAMTQVTTYVPFVVILMLVVLCFGGIMGCFPSITADAFGPKNLGMNYGIIFIAYGIAGFIGPRLASRVKEMNNGDYTMAFLIAASLSVIGVILVFAATRVAKKKQKMA